MKYIILVSLFICTTFNQLYAQTNLDPVITEIISRLKEGTCIPQKGEITDIANKLLNENQNDKLNQFIRELLELENDQITLELVNEIISISGYFNVKLSDSEQRNFESKIAFRRILIYDNFVQLQVENLQLANNYFIVQDFEKAKSLYSEIFSIPYNKLRGDDKNKFKYSKQLSRSYYCVRSALVKSIF